MSYREMREKFRNQEITKEEWNEYCTTRLFEIIQSDECKGVFERLSKA